MSTPIIVENCYTCGNCAVIKKICRLKNKIIQDINRDKCNSYSKRPMQKCELCEVYVVNLKNHVRQIHSKTMEEYKILTQLEETKKVNLRGRSLF
jgi:hypothetical protein